MLRAAAIFTLCEKLWTVCACLNYGKSYDSFLMVKRFFYNLKIGVNPSLSILKNVSETAPWAFIYTQILTSGP